MQASQGALIGFECSASLSGSPTGDEYFMHEFVHQPSHEECVTMSEISPSELFRRYTDMYRDYYDIFSSGTFSDGKSENVMSMCF